MARFNVRDILGHFIRRPAPEAAPCPHACCKGKRPHPGHLPVMLSDAQLRELPDEVLYQHADSDRVRDDGDAFAKIIKELTKRENATERRQKAAARARNKRATRSSNYRDYLEAEWVHAETATNGYMLNKRGKARGIDPRSLWTANDRTRAAYASDELRAYWQKHPPQSVAEFHAGRQRPRHRLYDIY